MNNETSDFMFGDFVRSNTTAPVAESTIQNLVKNIARAGGYIFNRLGKIPIPCNKMFPGTSDPRAYHDGYTKYDSSTDKTRVYTYVSDVLTQFIRTRDGDGSHYAIYTPGEIDINDPNNLIQCVIDDDSTSHIAPLDYESVVYYYTACMALGLVDSVEKNMNIKTWSAAENGIGSKSGVFFYDMDTALGKNNSGDKVSYFAFSDYWKSNITRYDAGGNIIPDDDTTTEVARVVNNGVTNFRDTFFFNSGVEGYDTPSSFLFAIAKYAYSISDAVRQNSTIFPQQVYAK